MGAGRVWHRWLAGAGARGRAGGDARAVHHHALCPSGRLGRCPGRTSAAQGRRLGFARERAGLQRTGGLPVLWMLLLSLGVFLWLRRLMCVRLGGHRRYGRRDGGAAGAGGGGWAGFDGLIVPALSPVSRRPLGGSAWRRAHVGAGLPVEGKLPADASEACTGNLTYPRTPLLFARSTACATGSSSAC